MSSVPLPTRFDRRILIGKKFLFSGIVVLFTLVMCEIGLRLFWHNNLQGGSNIYIHKLRLRPASRDCLIIRRKIYPDDPSVHLRTNENSYILPMNQYENPTATVVFLGGSTTECAIVKEELRFPVLVSHLLSQDGKKVNTLNASNSGNTSHDSINILLNRIVVRNRPDMVVMMHATNDIGVLAADGNYKSRASYLLGLGEFTKWAKNTVSSNVFCAAISRQFLSGISATITPYDPKHHPWKNDSGQAEKIPVDEYRARLATFVDICENFDIQPVLMTQPLSGNKTDLTPEWSDLEIQGRFNIVIRQVGKDKNIPIIDLEQFLIREVPDWDAPMNIFYDGMHVTDKGSEVYGQYIAEQLMPLIRKIHEEKLPKQR